MNRTLRAFCLAGIVIGAGCAGPQTALRHDMVWQGEVRIAGVEEVPAGATLVIRPGTRIVFAFRDADGDGWGDAGLLVRGRIVAVGTEEEPIVFVPQSLDHSPGRWGEIRLESAGPSRFAHSRFLGGGWALHSHLTALKVESCYFADNRGGIKFRGGPVSLYGNNLHRNGTAIRYWESDPEIISNLLSDNGSGIFCRQGSVGTLIRGNNFIRSADYHVKLGELQAENIDARFNYWGTDGTDDIETFFYDKKDVPYLGRVIYEPAEDRPFPLGAIWEKRMRRHGSAGERF